MGGQGAAGLAKARLTETIPAHRVRFACQIKRIFSNNLYRLFKESPQGFTGRFSHFSAGFFQTLFNSGILHCRLRRGSPARGTS